MEFDCICPNNGLFFLSTSHNQWILYHNMKKVTEKLSKLEGDGVSLIFCFNYIDLTMLQVY